MSLTESVVDFKYFIDDKFTGVDKLNDSCTTNISTVTKFIRILKEYSVIQDIYSKALAKNNLNLIQLSKSKSDCFYPIIEVFSNAFSTFTSVQKEFNDSLNLIIKNLTSIIENNDDNLNHVSTSRDSSVISNFKNSQIQMLKARVKYTSVSGNSESFNNDDKSTRKLKENYEASIEKYNKLRIIFLDSIQLGFDRSKQKQLHQLDKMRNAIKHTGNAIARIMFDLKESVDLIKRFYKATSKESLFRQWVESNKTTDDISVECFPMMSLDSPDCLPNESLLIDIGNNPPLSHLSVTNTFLDTKPKKSNPSRRNIENPSANGANIIDQDIPDLENADKNSNNKKIFDKNVNLSKTPKNKFTPLTIFKRFQSTSDLVSETETKDTPDEESWQSKSNLNANVTVDDEGFIIRDTKTSVRTGSCDSSSSDSGSDKRMKGIKVHIRPVTNSFIIKTASKSEVINAAMQLPIPKREKDKVTEARRGSNLQRSPMIIHDIDKDRYSRRSRSVFDLTCQEQYSEASGNIEDRTAHDNVVIPIASAMTEILSSNDGGSNCIIQGQLVLAWPLYIKQYLQSLSSKPIIDSIAFEFLSDSHGFSSAQILKQYRDVTKLEVINSNRYSFIVFEDFLQRIIADESLACRGNRISVPILEYSMKINADVNRIIDCSEQWSKIDGTCVQFYFTLSSKYFDENKEIMVNIKLLSGGSLEHLSSNKEREPEVHNQRFWSIKYGKSDDSVAVKIRTDGQNPLVRLKLGYEFVFENCSLASPHLVLQSGQGGNSCFKISLMHYRTISTGNFSQSFDFTIT